MAGSVTAETGALKRSAPPADAAMSSDAETASQSSKSRRRKEKKLRRKLKRESASSSHTGSDHDSSSSSKKRSKKRRKHLNGAGDRRPSLSLPARDPRDSGLIPAKMKPVTTKKSEDAALTRSPSPMIDFDGLSKPSLGTRTRLEESSEDAQARRKKMEGAVRTLLECVGEDVDRAGILDTPRRYAEAMLFFTKGYQQNLRTVVNNAIFEEGHRELVVVKDIEIFSLCEHHLVPFNGKMHIGYIPKDQVIGISKLPRIAEMFARRLQIQERLTKDVANALMEVLQPQGVVVVMESSHLCMVMRGVEKTTTSTVTSCVLGCFEKKAKTRNEFFSLLGMRT